MRAFCEQKIAFPFHQFAWLVLQISKMNYIHNVYFANIYYVIEPILISSSSL